MSKKNKRPDAPEEEVVVEETAAEAAVEELTEAPAEEPAAEAAQENAAVAEESANIEPAEEVPAAVETEGAAPESAPEPVDVTETQVAIVSRPVNFRTGASFNNAVIAELKSGSRITVTGTVEGEKGKWYECEFDGRKGFVKATGITV